MAMQLQRRHAGKSIEVMDEPLARGGEGTIHSTEDPRLVAKLFHHANMATFLKLEAMVRHFPSNLIHDGGHVALAWPVDILTDPRAKPVGFLMPAIEGGKVLLQVCNPQSRAQNAPEFNWRYLHVAAFNYALCMDSIHAKGYVVGDVRTENVLVNRRAQVTLIDLDSIQIKDPTTRKTFRCGVATEGFTPPELLRTSDFAAVDRNDAHDRFGMAVVIFYLLMGYHPFQFQWNGKGEPPSLNQLIGDGGWRPFPPANGNAARTMQTSQILHPALQNAFAQCFSRGHARPTERPAAKFWAKALEAAIRELGVCAKQPNHFYYASVGDCPWCRQQQLLGVDVFEDFGTEINGNQSSAKSKLAKRHQSACPGCKRFIAAAGDTVHCAQCQSDVHRSCLKNGARVKAGWFRSMQSLVCPRCQSVLDKRKEFAL